MPALGMQQDTGRLIAWLKAEGEPVTKGEPVMEIETDKTIVEIEAPASGILGGVRAQEGDTVPVGQAVAWILAPGEGVPLGALPQGPVAAEIASRGIPISTASPAQATTGPSPTLSATPVARKLAEKHGVALSQVKGEKGRIRQEDVLAYIDKRQQQDQGARLLPASPKARRLARERGLDLKDVVGTGPGSAVLAADVPDAGTLDTDLLATELPTSETRILEPGGMWQVMVNRLTGSWATTPQFHLVREVDASRLVAWRENAQRWTGSKLTYSDMLVKLVAASLARHPRLNASWHQDKIVLHHSINVGLAVAVEDGLVVPVLHGADSLSLGQIAARRQELIGRAQSGKLALEDLSGGTFTISNLGMYGVDMFNAVVNPPQAAILAVGRITERAVSVGGQLAVRPVMVFSLTCDHRAVDGARAAEFLQTLVSLVEEPALLVD